MRYKSIILFLISTLFLVACTGESVEEQMYQHMEESVRLESEFVAQQEPLSELERKEQEIYQEISELSVEEFDQIKELADLAIESIEQRKELIEAELSSIENSKKEFDKITPLVEGLVDEELKAVAIELLDMMEERYQAYLTLHEAYQTSLNYDTELYELLKKEDLEEPEFTEQIEKVNGQYQVIIDSNGAFNDATESFNSMKREFYNLTDLNITYN
ncbi:YkyA family protein [Amphibacillus xylanus]|uniref:Cell-wall binding lipoprotein n=1 Tax=Amphibacillus xylanus (strain ATCC 51415 / DSM 6626 / JCM 7361 / LMG 17667 / NBRC 15112 / Ep01) TaxID=698758 RepID=K0J7Q0_AMPXN|nr:YkyA family protein [Amphibacillus xylanus]BAM47753.1 hypothetical protein AXY_16210 [Amphibacillus xylanus NBRC 15112]